MHWENLRARIYVCMLLAIEMARTCQVRESRQVILFLRNGNGNIWLLSRVGQLWKLTTYCNKNLSASPVTVRPLRDIIL